MGQKINPKSLRLNITDTWKSRWLARSKFAAYLQEDVTIRQFLTTILKKAGIVRIDIERFANSIQIIIKTTKPGMIIGKGGGGVEELRKKVQQHLGKKLDLKINVEEVKEMNLQAAVVATNIAEQIEKRVAYRRVMKGTIEQVMESGALGVKIEIAGRLGGSEIARREWLFKGKLPLHTLRANIDFASATAFTTYGTIGVKVWINKGEVFDKSKT